ncbi:MAG: hypothetical protein RIT14_1640 [Pseudomonadota bacterium]
MTPDPITRLVRRNLCTGCGVCAGLAPAHIRMVEDREQGRRPVVDDTPAARAAARQALSACAGKGADFTPLPRHDATDQIWGPVLAIWEGWATDPDLRHRGASGGVASALSLFALTTGAVQAVAHTAAHRDDPRRTETRLSTDRAGLLGGAGSRYAQSSPGEVIARLTAPTLVTGKPCDVASLCLARSRDADLARKVPLMLAIFCAGTPTLAATDRLLRRLGLPPGARLTGLRYRGAGWPGLMQAWWEKDGKTVTSPGIAYAEGWGGLLQDSRRWRCRICADHTGAFADISVGDPWHAPPVGNTDAGRSLIIARSPAGLALITAAIAAGAIAATPRPRDIIDKAQPNLRATQGALWGRRLAMRLMGLPVPADRGLPLFALWRALTARQKAQSLFGTARRILTQRLWSAVVITARRDP